MTDRQTRIATLRASIIARGSAAASRFDYGDPAIAGHLAINRRTTRNKYPDVARYWADRRLRFGPEA